MKVFSQKLALLVLFGAQMQPYSWAKRLGFRRRGTAKAKRLNETHETTSSASATMTSPPVNGSTATRSSSPSGASFCTLRLIEGNDIIPQSRNNHATMTTPQRERHQVVVCEVQNDVEGYQVLNVNATRSQRDHVIRAAATGSSMVELTHFSANKNDNGLIIDNAKSQIILPSSTSTTRRQLQPQDDNSLPPPPPPIELNRCHKGSRGVRLVRVRFKDAEPLKTLDEWKDEIVNGGISPKRKSDATPFSQFHACSGGQVSMSFKAAHDVYLPNKSVWDYQNYRTLLFHMTKHVLEDVLGVDKDEDDHALFCVPVAPGGFSFVGAGVKGGNRVILSEDWCSDMTAVVHEMGHNCGLGHALSYQNGLDDTWVMGATGAGEQIGYPKRCFSPVDSFRMGWFRPHTYFLSDMEVQEGVKLNLVGFTESTRLRKRDIDPMILVYQDYRIQFNTVSELSNGDTLLNRGAVTILKVKQNGDSYPEGSLWERNRTDFQDGLTFKVCRVIGAGGRFQSAHLSIGVNGKLHCRKPLVNQVTATVTAQTSTGVNRQRHLATIDGGESSSLINVETIASEAGGNNLIGGTQIVLATRPGCGEKHNYKIAFHWPYGGSDGTGRTLQRRCSWLERSMSKLKKQLLCHQPNSLSTTTETVRSIWQYCKNECDEWAQCIRPEEFPEQAESAHNIFHS